MTEWKVCNTLMTRISKHSKKSSKIAGFDLDGTLIEPK
jgi:hypothetical protein